MRWRSTVLLAMLAASTANAAVDAPSDVAGRAEMLARQHWASIARDGSPRERALVSRLPMPGEGVGGEWHRTGAQLRSAAEAAPGDELVQWMWAAAPAEWSGCDERHPCPDRPMALARLAPDNAIAWFPVLADARKRGDLAAGSEALRRMAGASHFSGYFAATVGAWRDLLERHPVPAAALPETSGLRGADAASRRLQDAIMGAAFAAAQPWPLELTRTCDATVVPSASAADLANCQRVAHLMQGSTSVMERMIGAAVLRRAGGVPEPGFDRQRQWWQFAHRRLDDDRAETMRYFEDLRATGSEIRAIELVLHRAGLPLTPPADWVYVPPTFAPQPSAPD